MKLSTCATVTLLSIGAVGPTAAQVLSDEPTTLMTRKPDGSPAGEVIYVTVGPLGRYYLYTTEAAVIARDQNGEDDVYLYDRFTGAVELVSISTGGELGKGFCSRATISADGRYVAFSSSATELVPGDTNDSQDAFVRDRVAGTLERVSLGVGDSQADDNCVQARISAGGGHVVFASEATTLVAGDSNGDWDIFVRDLAGGVTTRVSVSSSGVQGNDTSVVGTISGDGRYVAFESNATNLVPGDTNGARDVFVHDRETGETVRVSVASDGTQANDCSLAGSISEDGRHVVFVSRADNLAPGLVGPQQGLFVRDLETGTTEVLHSVPVDLDFCIVTNVLQYPRISADGQVVAYYGVGSDLGSDGVFRIDRGKGTFERVDVSCQGETPIKGTLVSLSRDGRWVAFNGHTPGLWTQATESSDGYLNGPGLQCAALEEEPTLLSAGQGGVLDLALAAGPAFGAEAYVLLGSTAGVSPGLSFGDLVLPLAFDGPSGYVVYSATHPNEPPLENTAGALDPAGRARASITLEAGVAQALAGTTLHHAYVVLDPEALQALAVSTPVGLSVLP